MSRFLINFASYLLKTFVNKSMKHVKTFQREMREAKYLRDLHSMIKLVFTDQESLHLDALHGQVAVEGGPLSLHVHLTRVLVFIHLILERKGLDICISLVHNPS